MQIQKSQIDMMMRIQKEMRIALWERVKELEENKVRIEEENEKLRERIEQLEASKGSFQKRFSGFCPLRGGGCPPCPLSFFEHNDCPLRGGGVPPPSVKEKIR